MKLLLLMKEQALRNYAFPTWVRRQNRLSRNKIQTATMNWNNSYFNPRIIEKRIITFHLRKFKLNQTSKDTFICNKAHLSMKELVVSAIEGPDISTEKERTTITHHSFPGSSLGLALVYGKRQETGLILYILVPRAACSS